MNSKRPTVESLSQRILFDLQRVSEPASRPFSLPGVFLGTSAFSNNHYAGHGPATAKLFMDLWNKKL